MKIKVNIDLVLEVEGKQAEDILNNDKSALLMTIIGGNTEGVPQLGRWYPRGEYSINDTIRGIV